MFCKVEDGWTCVIVINDNRLHLNSDAIDGIKLSDHEINKSRRERNKKTPKYKYNLKVKAHDFLQPKNDWISYPHTLYFTNDYEFSSIKKAIDIPYSNLISLSENDDPIEIHQGRNSIGFGCGDCGDTFFAYASVDEQRNGLFQSFSGVGFGTVWIR